MSYQSRPARSRSNNGFSRSSSRPTSRSSTPKRGNSKQAIDPRKFVKAARPTTESTAYHPKNTFSDFKLSPKVLANLTELGYTSPTPIQDQSIPEALQGKDVLGLANTGTGKTAAFLLPLIERVLSKYDTETVLILAPTRELAQQIEAELRGFSKGLKLGSALVIGGAAVNPQLAQLRRNPHFVIGTPGRIRDMINRKAINLSKFSAIVLDEVDRMLDMGFVREIKQVLSELPPERQSLFFSATITRDIEELINGFLNDPVKISVVTGETADMVEQNIVRVPHDQPKIDLLHDLLVKEGMDRVLVFGETKHGVERLSKQLVLRGFTAASIHGNKSQGQRSRAIDAFKGGEIKVLVATDVAARGIDIKDITHVINYDLPNTYADYTHRIGRTGRAGKIGHALTFVH